MINRSSLILFLSILLTGQIAAQFHTLKIPQASNYVSETQRLGVTDISIEYHSPKVNERDVWNNPDVIPQNGYPIPWRAGANMNTTIEFSTDVEINGQPLAKGKYGFHVIPKDDMYELLFAHNNNQWGSYYLDIDHDITLSIDVKDTLCVLSESLDFEFIPKSESAMVIGLEWATKRLPFEVTVDLNTTVIESFQSELRGINTYRWEAWNDAAKWCLDHDTNLEQALEWANRSINGGYNGFAADKNMENVTTKARLLKKLGRTEEFEVTIIEAMELECSPYQANGFTIFLLHADKYKTALEFANSAVKKHPNTWFLELNQGICKYMTGDKKNAVKQLKKVQPSAPEGFRPRIAQIIDEMTAGTYKLG